MGARGLCAGALLVLPILQLIGPIEPWLPSKLLGATTSLLAGESASELLKSLAVTVLLVPVLLAGAILRLERREL